MKHGCVDFSGLSFEKTKKLCDELELDDSATKIQFTGILSFFLLSASREVGEHVKCILDLLKMTDSITTVILDFDRHRLGYLRLNEKKGSHSSPVSQK